MPIRWKTECVTDQYNKREKMQISRPQVTKQIILNQQIITGPQHSQHTVLGARAGEGKEGGKPSADPEVGCKIGQPPVLCCESMTHL